MILTLVKDALYINFRQFKRLITHEDGAYFHMHKILGGAVLCHFVYRLYNLYRHGEMLFDGSLNTLFCIIFHAMLHISSFEFILPKRRNKVYNIIWPEMRWHSLIFAYRSIITMILIWLCMNEYITQSFVVFMRGPIVIATIICADTVTNYYKRNNIVDISDSSMRGNPYPSYIGPKFIKIQNIFYSVSQALGTTNILYRGINMVFLQLFAIQIAPFGMTLVKKGVITQSGWHLMYTLALFLSYLYSALIPLDATNTVYLSTVIMFSIARFYYNMNKYLLWSIAIALQLYTLTTNPNLYETMMYYSNNAMIWRPLS